LYSGWFNSSPCGHQTPMIVCGDFNSIIDSAVYTLLGTKYVTQAMEDECRELKILVLFFIFYYYLFLFYFSFYLFIYLILFYFIIFLSFSFLFFSFTFFLYLFCYLLSCFVRLHLTCRSVTGEHPDLKEYDYGHYSRQGLKHALDLQSSYKTVSFCWMIEWVQLGSEFFWIFFSLVFTWEENHES
jgi:hypothetical protein